MEKEKFDQISSGVLKNELQIKVFKAQYIENLK